jgi:outer membrane receptor protein involved in Fe transport
MENGWVYWSNWAGLGDVTSSIQVQRGLGSSPYSVNSIGGVVNVTTIGVGGREDFARLKTEFGSDNLRKTTVAFATNISKNVGLTALVSRKTWDGYAINTPLDEFTYFFSFGGVFGDHSLELTGIGSPQTHGQRTSSQTLNTWYNRGFDYNANWGYLHGNVLGERINNYHKPAFNLNWNWQVNDQSLLSNVYYISFGNGYGTGTLGSYYSRKTDGTIDWDAVWATNTTNPNGESSTILRNSVNNHFWTGLLSTFKHQLNDEMTLNIGFDGRYYLGMHYREVRNLLGGDYYIDNSDDNHPNNRATVGDKVAYHNNGYVLQYGGFGQFEYSTGEVSTFLNVSVSQTGFRRKDFFNFLSSDPDRDTGTENILGYTAKGGLNYNIDENNNIFANVGYFSRAPVFDNVYDFANNKYDDIENEKVLGIEAGYGVNTPSVALVVNGYYTQWKDRAISRSTTDPVTDIDYFFNITGTTQIHYGGELEGRWKATRNLEFGGSFSWGENKYDNDVSAIKAPEDNPNLRDTINAYVKDLFVGDFPLTNASVYMVFTQELSNGMNIYFNPVYRLHSRHYANFDPDRRTDPTDRAQSWRLPDYYILDVHTGFNMLLTDFFFEKLSIGLHVFNALNNLNYIVGGSDGSDHNAQTSRVWMGRGRWWNLSFSFDF